MKIHNILKSSFTVHYGILESKDQPHIIVVKHNPASIIVQFPSGRKYEYMIYEESWLNDILKIRKYPGRLVAKLKKLVDAGVFEVNEV
jgi:hypothetical protein